MSIKWWWLSFADASRPVGTQFLGVVIVAAHNLIEAVRLAHFLGINPGGEVRGGMLADDTNVEGFTERLLTREDCDEFMQAQRKSNGA